jgi:membrane protein YqaA with SNARE-associated domain
MDLMHKAERWFHSKWLLPVAFFASLLECTLIPIPLELVLIPAMIARRDRIWALATAVLAGCVVGSLLGYGVGYFLWDLMGEDLLRRLDWLDEFNRFQTRLESQAFWAILFIGVTPTPFQVAMLGAGALGYSLPLYIVATLVARGIRYYGLAGLVALFGDQAVAMFKKHKVPATIALTLLVVGGWFVTKVLL